MSGGTVRVAHVERATSAEGPGLRWVLWLQGCTIGCADCCNPHMWDATSGWPAPVRELVADMLAAPVEGITLLGGEPFEQAAGAAEITAAAQANGRGVMTFTGYRYEVLQQRRDAATAALLATTDLLVDGPFLRDQLDTTRAWVGSKNQRLIHLTDRYKGEPAPSTTERLEIRVRRDGTVAVNGWPEATLVDALERLIEDV